MSEILDKIVDCSISIESPVMDAESFGTILLIGRPPIIKEREIAEYAEYSSLKAVTEKGWKEDSAMYLAAKAAFLQEAKSIYIALWKDDEDITASVNRALDSVGWYGMVVVDADTAEYEKVADIIEPTEKLFCFSTADVGSPLTKEYMRTFGIYSDKDSMIHVAWMANCFKYDAGSETWAYKTLAGVPASEYNSGTMKKLEDANLSYYIACAGKNITQGGKTIGGEWIDVIRFRDWLKNRLQIAVYSLFVSHPKIPYTDNGIVLVENMMESVLKNGQQRGGIDQTRFDDDGTPDYGYVVTVPKASSLNASQRASRVLKNCKFTARLSGAIHLTELSGNLVY